MKAVEPTLAGCALAALAVFSGACGGNDENGERSPGPGSQGTVARSDTVSDQGGAAATDPKLVNAWGLAFNPRGFAWVSATESGVSEVYAVDGRQAIPPVTIPGAPGASSTSAPTGQFFNQNASAFQGDTFIFVSEDGVISGWQESFATQARLRVDNSTTGAIYKGVAIAQDSSGNARLFAADFHGGKVDVFDASYASLQTSGGFRDTDLPSGFAPFGIEPVNGALVVTYAKQDEDHEDDVKGAGNGYLDLFDVDGALVSRLVSNGELNSPWGVVMTPASFGAAPNRLLVGNFGDGLIHVYQLDMSVPGTASARLEGTLRDTTGNSLVIDGLWALEFPPDAGGFRSDQLYFTAGPGDEAHGVFGHLETTALSGAGGSAGSGGFAGTGGGPGMGGTAGSGVGGSPGMGGY